MCFFDTYFEGTFGEQVPQLLHLEISREHEKIGVRCPTSGVHLSGDNCRFKLGRHRLEVLDGDVNVPVDGDQKFDFQFVLGNQWGENESVGSLVWPTLLDQLLTVTYYQNLGLLLYSFSHLISIHKNIRCPILGLGQLIERKLFNPSTRLDAWGRLQKDQPAVLERCTFFSRETSTRRTLTNTYQVFLLHGGRRRPLVVEDLVLFAVVVQELWSDHLKRNYVTFISRKCHVSKPHICLS